MILQFGSQDGLPVWTRRQGSEQLTYLLFLKMANERTKPSYNKPSAVPAEDSWSTLIKQDGDRIL
jgi:hypothetical protein